MLVEDIMDGHENAKEAKIKLKKYKQSIGVFSIEVHIILICNSHNCWIVCCRTVFFLAPSFRIWNRYYLMLRMSLRL